MVLSDTATATSTPISPSIPNPLEDLFTREDSPFYRPAFQGLIRHRLSQLLEWACPEGSSIVSEPIVSEAASEAYIMKSLPPSQQTQTKTAFKPQNTTSWASMEVVDRLLGKDESTRQEIWEAVSDCYDIDRHLLDLVLTTDVMVGGGSRKWLMAMGQFWMRDPRYVLDQLAELTAILVPPPSLAASEAESPDSHDKDRLRRLKALIDFVGYIWLGQHCQAFQRRPVRVTSVTAPTAYGLQTQLRTNFANCIEGEGRRPFFILLYLKASELLFNIFQKDLGYAAGHEDWVQAHSAEDPSSSPHLSSISPLSHVIGAGVRSDYLLSFDAALSTLLYPEAKLVDDALARLGEDRDRLSEYRALLGRE